MLYDEFGKRLAAVIKNVGITQKALAKELDVTTETIRRWKNGENRPINRDILLHCIEPLDFVQDEKGLEHCNALLIAAGYQALDDQEARLYGLQKTKTDWGEVPDISNFYGRIQDLETLTQWIVSDKCRFVNVLGMGGIGKTTLSAKLAQDIQNEFHYVMWRSLREAPPVEKILTDAINFFSNNKEIKLPDTLGEGITRLIDYLRESRCLLVLDNAESILQSCTFAGRYQAGYEGYAELIERVAECRHQSCLVLTSREKPKNRLQEGENYPIRSLQLSGLEELAGQQFFSETDEMIFSEAKRKKIIHYYGGNPLALQIVLADIQDWPNEDILKWIASLEDGLLAFERIEELLEAQFYRLSMPEKVVIYWLAINREPVSLFDLKADIVSPRIKNKIPQIVDSLRKRSLIEKVTDGFTLQNVVMEYCTERLIDKVVEHISQNRLALFNRHALMKATAKDYVRKTQIRLLLQPVWESLSNKMGPEGAEHHLKQLLSTLQKQSPRKPGYLAGNVLNLLCQMGRDLSGADFSDLTIRQAYLQGMNLHQINFAHSDFAQSVFTHIFGNILCMAFSPDGKRLATGDVNGQIHLWEVDNNEHILTIPAHHYWIYSVVFSPSGRQLASASSDQTVKIWDADNGQCRQILQRTATVFSVSFNPSNENILATAGRNHTVKLWEIEENQCIMQFKHEGTVFSAAFSPQGDKLVSGSDDKLVRIWDTNQGTCLHTLRGHTQSVQSVAFDPKGQWVASGSHDNTVKIWDVNQGECLHTLQEHHNSIWSVVFSPTGQFLASSSEDQTVKIWAIPANQSAKITRFKTLPHDNRVRTIAFSFQDNILASAHHDQSVKIWDIRQGSCLNTWQGYSHWIRALAFSAKGQHLLASGHYDHTVKLWDIRDGQCIKILRGHDNLICSLAFCPNGQLLASASSDRSIKLWNVANGQCIKTFFGHQGPVWSVVFSPNGQLLASGSEDKLIKLWHLDNKKGEALKTLAGHNEWIRSVIFSPNGQFLASGSEDKCVMIWNMNNLAQGPKVLQHQRRIISVTFSHDSQLLASASNGDKTIKIWDTTNWQCRCTLETPKQMFSVAFSPDNETLVSGGEDCIMIWDMHNHQCLHSLFGKNHQIFSVAFNSDGQSIASSGDEGIIEILDVKTGHCIKTLFAPKPYENMNISGVKGLTAVQKTSLKMLGAVEEGEQN